MKILYDDNVFSWQKYGGISRYFCQLMLNSESNYNWQLSVKYSENAYLAQNFNFFKINIPPLNKFFFEDWNFRGKNSIKMFINRTFKIGPLNYSDENRRYSLSCLNAKDYDVFHPTYYNDYFLNDHFNKPFVLTVHDMTHELYPQYFPNDSTTSRLKLKLMAEAQHLIAISESTKKDIMEIAGIPENKISVIHHGSPFECNSFTDQVSQVSLVRKMSLPKRYVLFTGGRSGYKNFSVLVEAMSVLMAQDETLELVCTGAQFSEHENQLLKKRKIKNRVRLYSTNDEQLFCLYKNALCFVFPSLYEGFGFPILEAFAAGCPTILSNRSSFPEIGSDAAYYFDPNDSDALARLIKIIISEDFDRPNFIKKGFKQYKKFTWGKTSLLTAQVYKKAISNHS